MYITGSPVRPAVVKLSPDLRTHEEFTRREPKEHHTLDEIALEELGLDMVQDFPFDYMHLCCLGVMKKLLNHWKNRETVALIL